MRVLALIYADEGPWETAGPEEQEAVYRAYREFGERAGDKVLGGAELVPTRAATTVRVRDHETVVTDGPAEQRSEPLAGFYLLDCSGLEAAELAAQIPGASTGAVELRAERVEGSQ